jgi:6,7-dimethyl-8-ribityllumazine synthase
MSSQDPAFYDHESDAPYVAPPVPRPIPGQSVPPTPSAQEPVASEPWPGEPAYVAPPQPEVEPEPESEPVAADAEPVAEAEPAPPAPPAHVEGELQLPEGYRIVEGHPEGGRAVGIVVSRFNGGITTQLLQSALDELALRGVSREAITIMPVPGAFELPIATMALAKTRRFACVVALGCVVRGETPHFDYVAGEAASGVQLAALETGIPIAFGVLTVDNEAQAQARVGKGAEAVRTALELADSFHRLRAAAASA